MNSKRLKYASRVLLANFALFVIGMILKSDLSDLGTGLSLINAPLYVYILGETFRKSGDDKTIFDKSK
jgi:hypothetical protein